MGLMWSTYVANPNSMPVPDGTPRFDSFYGFENGRKKRVGTVTEKEMIAAKLPKRYRDYCAHKLLEYEDCKKYHYPLLQSRCGHQLHDWQQCQFEDYVLRMKEYERERRLLERQKRKEQAAAA
ncbi:hypothetical protein M0802_016497 [Mischocyttarus mexicanus]|nr:hypothetical protein M0802_016497 [Mischocyttarus mexicanus]